ncbi:hypothetical protein B0H63DRAFT_455822 [Podospora didyma]|uniref:Nephrocystin 3-like N-terminal domain-containing protein n=1 Tax=Podospora didyma TaxID=330526 RepID=A0AAE0N1Y6_9PEZI|nr:hypothetical protein B0H63DRAFT_455822 [Podospora didyma]
MQSLSPILQLRWGAAGLIGLLQGKGKSSPPTPMLPGIEFTPNDCQHHTILNLHVVDNIIRNLASTTRLYATVNPLSAASSIAGLVSIAESLFRLVFKYVKSVQAAKNEIVELADEMKTIAGILHSLSLLPRRTMSRIKQPLVKAERDIESSSRFDAFQRRLKWPSSSSETKDLLAELSRHKETISLALAADSVSAIAKCLSRQDEIVRRMSNIQGLIDQNLDITTRIALDSNHSKVLDSFLTVNPQHNLEMSLKLRHPLTGLRLTEGETFQQWLESSPSENASRLWLSGIPGIGKTFLAGAMIESVMRSSHDTATILGALASQIARQNDEAFALLQEYYDQLHPTDKLPRSPDIKELVSLLKLMSCEFFKTFIIVDALDEYGDKLQMANVVHTLKSLVLPVGHMQKDDTPLTGMINLTLVSRDKDPIRNQLENNFMQMKVEAHAEDLQIYTAAEVDNRIRNQLLRINKPGHKDEIIDYLVSPCRWNIRMFRWVSCQIDELCKFPTDKARIKAPRELPPSLNDTYERILKRLCEAISISDDGLMDSKAPVVLDPEETVDEREIAFSCGSLIRKSSTGEHFEFAHFTVKEFLETLDTTKPHLALFPGPWSLAATMLIRDGQCIATSCSVKLLLVSQILRS